ncbi:MAG: phosphoribosylformylglycinamidine cyclo-ligase [Bdellovibrionales bacterium]|nr:phosphoribosylformylglycinamidine cyclo-ligase [Bdellovibrionales bacterium]
MDYKSAGVDIEKGDLFVEKIGKFIKDTYDSRVISGVGGFAALYEMDEERLLASGTDGVGTKVKLAQELGVHHTIGQDLVGMCVNDVLCTGARPMFFLDYFATGKLDLQVSTQVVQGIATACKEAKLALIGGETAEMPGVYAEGVYDLAGFAVGEVLRREWINGSQAKAGQTLIGVRSSGFHSNGYSLVRALLKPADTELKKQLLTPTRLYTKTVMGLLSNQRDNITGIAHITGGGFHNIPRINESLGYEITRLPADQERPAAMNEIVSRAKLDREQAYKTFNMGVGMVFLVKDEVKALAQLQSLGEQPVVLGKTSDKFQGLKL